MKLVLFALLFLSATAIWAQEINNLQELTKFNVMILDRAEGLGEKRVNKLSAEIKGKLIGLGLKYSEDESAPVIVIETSVILSKFAAHRALVQLYLLEHVSISRKSSVKALARTYNDQKFFETQSLGADTYNAVMDELIVNFINKLLESK